MQKVTEVEEMTEYESQNGMVTDEAIKKYLQDNEYQLTKNPQEALYILRDGSLISSNYEYGSRTEDYRMIEGLISEGKELYTGDPEKFWGALHAKTGLIRVVPETQEALIGVDQSLSQTQRELIKRLDYQVDEYVKMPEIKLNQRKTVLDMYELGEVLARTEQQEGDYKGTYVAFDKENGTYFGLDNRDGKLKEPVEYHSYEEAKRAIDSGENLKASLELTQEVKDRNALTAKANRLLNATLNDPESFERTVNRMGVLRAHGNKFNQKGNQLLLADHQFGTVYAPASEYRKDNSLSKINFQELHGTKIFVPKIKKGIIELNPATVYAVEEIGKKHPELLENALTIAQRNNSFLKQPVTDRIRQINKVLVLTNQRLDNPKAALSLHIARYLTTSSTGLKEEFKLRNDEKELFKQLPVNDRQKIFNEAQKLSRELNLRVKREFIKEKEHHKDKKLNRPTTKSRER